MSFNGQEKRCELFLDIIKLIAPAAIFETGTYHGDGTHYMASHFEGPVYTCENNAGFLEIAKARLSDTPNAHISFSDSRHFLEATLPKVTGSPLFFYLDAHWGDLPLREEIEIILQNDKPSVIMIDDFRVPDDAGYGFDSYGYQSIDLAYISFLHDTSLGFFFPSTPSHEETGAKRGCIVITTPDLTPVVAQTGLLRSISRA